MGVGIWNRYLDDFITEFDYLVLADYTPSGCFKVLRSYANGPLSLTREGKYEYGIGDSEPPIHRFASMLFYL